MENSNKNVFFVLAILAGKSRENQKPLKIYKILVFLIKQILNRLTDS